jgi:hypothetical protein
MPWYVALSLQFSNSAGAIGYGNLGWMRTKTHPLREAFRGFLFSS